MSAPVEVEARAGVLSICDPALFAAGREARAELFARRVFRCADVRSLRLDPSRAAATLDYAAGAATDAARVVEKMAGALASSSDEIDLPPWRAGEVVTVRRFGRLISTVEGLSLGARRLRVRHPALRLEPQAARRLEQALSARSGVDQVGLTFRTGILQVRFDPRRTSGKALLRQIETALARPAEAPSALQADPPGLGLPLATLALSATADLAVPALLPAAGALSVMTSLDTLGAAVGQLAAGKVGLPALQAAVVVTGLFTGSFLPGAVSLCLLRLWERQHERDLTRGTAVLIEDIYAVAAGQTEASAQRRGGAAAAEFARAAVQGALALPSPWAPTLGAERFSSRAVLPTLALAAVALLAQGPRAATAVMRPDYATGAGLADSLRRLQASRAALRDCVLIRSHEALGRLADASWLILDDPDAPDAAMIRLLQDAGLRVFLASARPPAEAAELARRLGADAHLGKLDQDGKARLLGALRRRGVTFVRVADRAEVLDPRGGEVTVALGEPGEVDVDIALLTGETGSLPALHALARAVAAEDRRDRRRTLLVNLASVTAVLALGWTSLPVIGLSNANILVSRHRALGSVSLARSPERRRPVRAPAARPEPSASAPDETADLIRKIEDLPPDLGGVLVTVGVLGLLLPGLAGWPFLIAGAAVLRPGGRVRLARWAARNPSGIVRMGAEQVSRLADDLERRYPAAPKPGSA